VFVCYRPSNNGISLNYYVKCKHTQTNKQTSCTFANKTRHLLDGIICASLHVAGDESRPRSSDVLRSVRVSNGGNPGAIAREHSGQETWGLHVHIHPPAGLPPHLHEVKDVHRPVWSGLHRDVTCVELTVLYQLQKSYIFQFYMRGTLLGILWTRKATSMFDYFITLY
jgi:hypothetical protein